MSTGLLVTYPRCLPDGLMHKIAHCALPEVHGELAIWFTDKVPAGTPPRVTVWRDEIDDTMGQKAGDDVT